MHGVSSNYDLGAMGEDRSDLAGQLRGLLTGRHYCCLACTTRPMMQQKRRKKKVPLAHCSSICRIDGFYLHHSLPMD